MTSYCNVLDSILDTYYNNFDFFHQTSPHRNYSLAFTFYHYVLETVEMHARKERNLLTAQVLQRGRLRDFSAWGCWASLMNAMENGVPLSQIRAESKESCGEFSNRRF